MEECSNQHLTTLAVVGARIRVGGCWFDSHYKPLQSLEYYNFEISSRSVMVSYHQRPSSDLATLRDAIRILHSYADEIGNKKFTPTLKLSRPSCFRQKVIASRCS